jgi:antitoxin component YwqK of YwqJK toxin-antitoxin module
VKLLIIIIFLFSVQASACWELKGTIAVDGETFTIQQKVNHAKDYSFPFGTFIFNFKIITGKAKNHTITYSLVEKKQAKLNLITTGEDEISEQKKKEIYAKGEQGQPNTIFTFFLKHI